MGAQFVLASRSPRRRELLNQMGLRYRVVEADITESAYSGESPADCVYRIAAKKARRVFENGFSALPVLAADTIVVLEGKILGKPGTSACASAMLQSLSGRTHEVLTSVVLLSSGGVESRKLSVSRVTFAPIDPDWIAAYCNTSEPLDKAGAYAIQGYAAQWIKRLEGSYSGVMGLPLYETAQLLRQAGVAVP